MSLNNTIHSMAVPRIAIRIPGKIIEDSSLGSQRALFYCALARNRTIENSITCSVNYLVECCNLKPDSHPNRINNKFLQFIQQLYSKGFLIGDSEVEQIIAKPKEQSTSHRFVINPKLFVPDEDYAIVYVDELDRILHFKNDTVLKGMASYSVSSADILLILSYLRYYIALGFKGSNTSNKPKCCYTLHQDISATLQMDRHKVPVCIQILDTMKIVKCYEYIQPFKTNLPAIKIFANYNDFYNSLKGYENYSCQKEILKQIDVLERLRMYKLWNDIN